LNVASSLDIGEDKSQLDTVDKNIKVLITKLKGTHMNEDGSRVDYQKMADSDLFAEYCREAAKLKHIHPEKLSENKRKALFINIYNSLTIHSMVHQANISHGQLPDSPKDVVGFWKIHAYNIGGLIYSLDEIEHGVLRSNKGHPAACKPQFEDKDPRSKVALSELDPRIHFALNCGARSCPPIRVYTEEKIEDQLKVATKSFLEQEVTVQKTQIGSYEVNLSKLFLWYGADFGSDSNAILTWISTNVPSCIPNYSEMRTAGFSIVHRDYNWTSNLVEDRTINSGI